jgi:hypothetical protein
MEHRTGEIGERADAGVRLGDIFLVRPQKATNSFSVSAGTPARATSTTGEILIKPICSKSLER